MHVLVEYVLERKREVVPHKDIRSFFPVDIDDYERDCLYEVFWAGDSVTKGGYYDAKILHMTETMEEMSAFQKSRRQPSRPATSGNSAPPKKRAKTNKAAQAEKKSAEASILVEAATMEPASVAALKKRIVELEAEVEELKVANKKLHDSACSTEIQELRTLNRDLQKALCRKVLFSSTSPGSEKSVEHHATTKSVAAPLAPVVSCATTRPAAPPAPAVICANTGSAAPPAPDITCTSTGSAAPPALDDAGCEKTGTGRTQDAAGPRPTKALGQAAHHPDSSTGAVSDGQVHLGRGQYIDEQTWQRLLLLPTDAAFCKQLAVRIWGNDVLKGRSLTGTLSNKAISKGGIKPHKALSPIKVAALSDSFWYYLRMKDCEPLDLHKRHKLLARYVAQKCADLRR